MRFLDDYNQAKEHSSNIQDSVTDETLDQYDEQKIDDPLETNGVGQSSTATDSVDSVNNVSTPG